MDKIERAKEVRRELNALLPSVDRFVELLQEIIGDKLYEGEGYTTFSGYVRGWPELQNTILNFRAVTRVRRQVVVALHQEGKTQQQIAKTTGVTQAAVSKDLKAEGQKPKNPQGRKRQDSVLFSENNTESERPRRTASEIRQLHEKEEIVRLRKAIDRMTEDSSTAAGLARMLMPSQVAIFQLGRISDSLSNIIRNVQEAKDILTQELTDLDQEFKSIQ
jgi:predicted transcriptional regulator